VIGALCAERDRPIDASDVAMLEAAAAAAAPCLALMRLNEQPLATRLMQAMSSRTAGLASPTHLRLQLGLGAAALALLAAAVVPVDWRIGGHARLEGEFQRVLTAPADGFVQAVHARPGDVVKAGQPLLDLAEQDLQLEKRRWESQRSQFENATVAANARADRAQLVINQSKAAEAQAQLELVDMKLARSRIAAPFDGVVVQGDLSQSLGAPVAQGAELVTVAPRDRFRVMVEVDERDIEAVAVGQHGTLALSALPWNTLPIEVVRISPIATAVEGRNVFEVEAALRAQPGDLRPGLQGSAHIVAGERPLLKALTHRLTGWVGLAWWEWLG
jgi:RND family efflux transporter MFP subunit